ncbi:MAG: hypothetical protein HYY09_05025 [Firmicutes bacterium]|nr:hypothetical protein [Bacillota bacterium]
MEIMRARGVMIVDVKLSPHELDLARENSDRALERFLKTSLSGVINPGWIQGLLVSPDLGQGTNISLYIDYLMEKY